jgi:glutamate-5-semialdehyde dehydrogenase
MNFPVNLKKMAADAKNATHEMACATTDQKNFALQSIAILLKDQQKHILQANQEDIERAQAAGLSESLIDRLSLKGRLDSICRDIEQIIQLPDPIGEIFEPQQLPKQLQVVKCRTPIGVLGVIYESRPNVTIDVSVLTLKSGNCAILRGGSETLATNHVLVQLIQEGLIAAHLPAHAIQLIPSPERSQVHELLRLYDYIDLIIPRGGASLHRFCRENSTIPVITGGIGVCHLFADESANLDKSLSVIMNAKTQRPTVCNALDTLLVHEKIALIFIPQVINALQAKGVSFRLDPHSMEIAQKSGESVSYRAAQPEEWDTEWLSLVLGIKVVKNLEEAIQHIVQHSTGHSDGILTQNEEHAQTFVKEVDSAAVYVNASTRFTDGGQLGLGAEVAISTQKLHARGPMGLKELTSYKWVIRGDYTVRH